MSQIKKEISFENYKISIMDDPDSLENKVSINRFPSEASESERHSSTAEQPKEILMTES